LIALLPPRLTSRILAILAALGLAACSDNVAGSVTPGVSPTPFALGTAATATAATLKLTQVTPIPSLGTTGSFTLAVSAFTSSGAAITGSVNPVITLSTSDSSDLTLSQTTVSTGTANVVVTYDGKALPSGTTISASAGTVTTNLTIVSGATPTPVAAIKTLAVQELTPVPDLGTAGIFVITVNAVDVNGNAITGAYPSPVTLSTNDSNDLTLSTSTVSAGGANVTVTYNGKALPGNTVISASSGGISTSLAVTSTAAPQSQISSIALTPQGPGNLTVGSTGSFALAVTVNDANGNPISGTYPAPLTLTVNDSSALTFNGNPSQTISASGTGVTLLYNGTALVPGTTVTASIPGFAATAALGITANNPAYPAPVYSALSLTPQNVASIKPGTPGSFSVVVTAYDANGNQINSSFPLPRTR
jgi:hypothetical protein